MASELNSAQEFQTSQLTFRQYEDENDLPFIMSLVDEELSEPYSIFTYRYFVLQWPKLCFIAYFENKVIGTIVCKSDFEKEIPRGYIAMLVVIKPFRGKKIATELVSKAILAMHEAGCHEVVLEAEVTNKAALALYGNLGFIRAKRLHRYYLNGVDAFRLKLRLPQIHSEPEEDLRFYDDHQNCNHDHGHGHGHGHQHGHDCHDHDHGHSHQHGHGHGHGHGHSQHNHNHSHGHGHSHHGHKHGRNCSC